MRNKAGVPTRLAFVLPKLTCMKITKVDVHKLESTEGCLRCACVLVGGHAESSHNDRCRIRIAELLQQSDLGRGELKGYRRTDEVQEAVEPDDR